MDKPTSPIASMIPPVLSGLNVPGTPGHDVRVMMQDIARQYNSSDERGRRDISDIIYVTWNSISPHIWGSSTYPTNSLYLPSSSLQKRLALAMFLVLLSLSALVVPLAILTDSGECGPNLTIDGHSQAESFTCLVSDFAIYTIHFVVLMFIFFLLLKLPILILPEVLTTRSYKLAYDIYHLSPARS